MFKYLVILFWPLLDPPTVLQQEDNFDGNFTASNRVFKVSYDISWSYRTDRTY